MIMSKKAIPRRMVLRGLGATVALPLLDAMVPPLAAFRASAATLVSRFAAVYVPNGIIMEDWTPALEGDGFAFPRILRPLEPFRDHLLVVSGLDNSGSTSRTGIGGAPHAQSGASWLTGAEPVRTRGTTRLELGVSMDQVAARTLGRETQLPSLELGIEGSDTINGVGSCDPRYSCTYQNTISWSSPTTPLPMEANPRLVFERLFGDIGTTDPAVRLARITRQRSILDAVIGKVDQLRNGLGQQDRAKLDEYLEAVREVERRIQNAEGQGTRELPVFESPAGIPFSYDDHVRVMFDLQVLAYQTDLTRVITFQIGREQSGATYPQIGVSDSHHPISHHGGDARKIANVAKINTYHATLFAYFLEKLRSTADGAGSLLDHSIIVYGSALSDGNRHSHVNVPTLVVGGGSGQLKGGWHVKYPQGTPLSNLQLTLLHKLGVPVERFGNSTGTLTGLSTV